MPSPIRRKKAKRPKKTSQSPVKRAAKATPAKLQPQSQPEELTEAAHMFEADHDEPAFIKKLKKIEREKPPKKAP